MKRIDLLRRSSPHIILVIVAVFMLGTGCASGFRTVMPQPPEKYEKLGPASGSACGSMLIGPTAYNFIPVMLNSRVARAYQQALDSVPGSTALINVTMQEDWYWWVIGTARCVTIQGEAIR
jgi:hypothetical protein